MIARQYYDSGPARPFCLYLGCIPVNRDGKDLGAIRAALRTLEQGKVVAIFPEGKITPESGRSIGPGMPGAAFLAIKARVPIIPAYIHGTPATADVYEALYTPSNAHVHYGEPLHPSDLPEIDHADETALTQVTERLMASIYELRAKFGPSPGE